MFLRVKANQNKSVGLKYCNCTCIKQVCSAPNYLFTSLFIMLMLEVILEKAVMNRQISKGLKINYCRYSSHYSHEMLHNLLVPILVSVN